MSKWQVGDKVLTADKQKAEVIITYASAHCLVETTSGAKFTVKDKELSAADTTRMD